MAPNGSLVEEFDYVICGAGNSGCVVAGRLAEAGAGSILLVEAGVRLNDVPASAIPAGVSQILGTPADWNIWSEPCAHLDNRKLHLGRGKFVSGSSGTNGCLCIRGTRRDYDDWGEEGWSGDDVFNYMSKAESFVNQQPWFKANETAHGTTGPVVTGAHDPAPISWRVLDSFQSKGLPLRPDLFTTGEAADGCGHAVRTIHNGVRSTSAAYIQNKANIIVKTSLYVNRLILDDDPSGNLTATGVELSDADGNRSHVTARKEVILSCGSYGTPAVLMRSGIGAKADVENHGITLRHELPGVGQNLLDHMVLLNFYEVTGANITNDSQIWHTGGKEQSMAQYKADRTGFFSKFPFGCFAWARLDERLKDSSLWQQAQQSSEPGRDPMGLTPEQPHVEFWNTECYSPKYMFKDFPSDDKHAFAMVMTLFSPKSRGTVKLKSADPKDLPVVDHNYLSNPLDMLIFSESCRLANEIVLEGAGTKDIVTGSWPAKLSHHTYQTREEWEPVIRERADTCYHPAGTCKMGKADDPTAVVDSQLRVRGVQHLRVADASIMPSLNGGHPQMVCYAIGEKLADLLTKE